MYEDGDHLHVRAGERVENSKIVRKRAGILRGSSYFNVKGGSSKLKAGTGSPI